MYERRSTFLSHYVSCQWYQILSMYVEYYVCRPQFVASGDACGVVKVWRLSTKLTAMVTNEVEQLNSLVTNTATPQTL